MELKRRCVLAWLALHVRWFVTRSVRRHRELSRSAVRDFPLGAPVRSSFTSRVSQSPFGGAPPSCPVSACRLPQEPVIFAVSASRSDPVNSLSRVSFRACLPQLWTTSVPESISISTQLGSVVVQLCDVSHALRVGGAIPHSSMSS